MVEGELQSRNLKNDDGSNNNVVEIKARRIQFLNRQNKKDAPLLFDSVTEVTSEIESDISASADVEKGDVISNDNEAKKQWFGRQLLFKKSKVEF